VPYDTGLINLPIARSKNDFRKKEVVKAVGLVQGAAQSAGAGFRTLWRGEERDAVTRYKVIKRVEKFGEKLSVVAFYPETGRTHQIRVHAKSIGHPIVGDNLYGPRSDKSEKLENKIFKVTSKLKREKKVRHLLHAKSIQFLSPETGEVKRLESKPPKEFNM
jgi:23S rRNA-/tRNA-specific pseudouridylate synthase